MSALTKYLILLGVTFYGSAFAGLSRCARELDSAWNLRAGIITIEYREGAIFRLEREPAHWQKQQTRFPLPVRQVRPLQLSQRAFQSSAFVAGVEIRDPRVVWLGSLLFSEALSVSFPEEILDIAWLPTGPKMYRLYALSTKGVYSVEVENRHEKPLPGSTIDIIVGFASEAKSWDRLFASSADRVWLVRETGDWGRAESSSIHETKLVDWVYSLRSYTEGDSTFFCGIFSKAGEKQELCFGWDSLLGWQPAERPAALQRPKLTPGFLETADQLSPSMRRLLKNLKP